MVHPAMADQGKAMGTCRLVVADILAATANR